MKDLLIKYTKNILDKIVSNKIIFEIILILFIFVPLAIGLNIVFINKLIYIILGIFIATFGYNLSLLLVLYYKYYHSKNDRKY